MTNTGELPVRPVGKNYVARLSVVPVLKPVALSEVKMDSQIFGDAP
jgi:hypothetical protein